MALMTAGIAESQVSQQWVQRYTSDSTRDESVNDMFVDSQGNVYITGSQRSRSGAAQEIEALTVKYNSQGVQQWIQNYRAPGNNGAFSRAVHVDATGNVYVTGENALFSGGANEMLVIKYSPSGTQLWANRFQYITSTYAGGYDIITDADGNVYVTGEYGNTFSNIFLVKYGPSGNLINQTFYNSASEGGRKIGMDGSGKIIIGGYINDNDSLSFIALKYEQNLDFVWAARWGRGIGNQNPIDMAVDINSNIIITGTSGINVDYATVKIDPAGNVLWGNLYNSAGGTDLGRAVATDHLGNVYVTGQTGVNGFPLTNRYTTIKYNGNGIQQWAEDYGGSGAEDGYSAYDIAVDDSSNLYVTGGTYNNSDISTVKYNSSGIFKWETIYNGTGNGADRGITVGLDNSGNVYVSGNSFGGSTGNDIVTIKYSQVPIGINNISEQVPEGFSLSQNYPNPFNPSTKIRFEIKTEKNGGSSGVRLIVYDTQGREVAELLNGNLSPGTYEVSFEAVNLSSGIYFYKLEADGFSDTKKMMLIR